MKRYFKYLLIILALMVASTLVYSLIGSIGSDSEQIASKAASTGYKFTADQLYELYSSNKVAADKVMRGKTVTVTGEIYQVRKGLIGNSSITFRRDKGYKISTIQCIPSASCKDRFEKLAEGSKISIIGTCDGMITNVIVKNCKLAR
jgi:hypothetical protein